MKEKRFKKVVELYQNENTTWAWGILVLCYFFSLLIFTTILSILIPPWQHTVFPIGILWIFFIVSFFLSLLPFFKRKVTYVEVKE